MHNKFIFKRDRVQKSFIYLRFSTSFLFYSGWFNVICSHGNVYIYILTSSIYVYYLLIDMGPYYYFRQFNSMRGRMTCVNRESD